MSEILVDNLTGKTSAGDITVYGEGGTATQSLQQGLAKVWVNYNGTGTIAVRDSLNVTSLNDTGTGRHEYSFTNNMNNTDYTHIGGAGFGSYSTTTFSGLRPYGISPSTSQAGNNILFASGSFSTVDTEYVASSNHGDLA